MTAWPRALGPRAVGAILAFVTGCGALDESAPLPPPPAKTCPTVDQQLAPLLQLTDQGRLQHIAALIEHELDDASHRAMLQLVLEVAKALPPGSGTKLPKLLESSGLEGLVPVVIAILEPLPGRPLAEPPIPPKTAEMTAFSGIARNCVSQRVFVTLADVLREPAMAHELDGLLGEAGGLLPVLHKALQGAGVEGRPAFTVLVRNLLISLEQPGFDPRPLLASLHALAGQDPQSALRRVHRLAAALLLDAQGQPHQKRLEGIGEFAGCVLRLDPDQRVMGHAWDVLLAAPLAEATTPTLPAPGVTAELLAMAAQACDVLAEREAARDAMAQVFGLVLRPDIATQAVPELVDLLQSDALPAVLGLVADLVAQPCRPEAAP